jgi:hypothetical protein
MWMELVSISIGRIAVSRPSFHRGPTFGDEVAVSQGPHSARSMVQAPLWCVARCEIHRQTACCNKLQSSVEIISPK